MSIMKKSGRRRGISLNAYMLGQLISLRISGSDIINRRDTP